MASWTDIQSHMRETYRLQVDEPARLSMAYAYEDGRTQKIVIRRFEQDGVDMVELKSPFARIDGPDPLELLRENVRLPIGAVALSGDVYIVVENMELGPLTLEAFEDRLAKVASLADRLESKHAPSVAQDAF